MVFLFARTRRLYCFIPAIFSLIQRFSLITFGPDVQTISTETGIRNERKKITAVKDFPVFASFLRYRNCLLFATFPNRDKNCPKPG